MITISNLRIRLPLDVSQWAQAPIDQITNAGPKIAAGSDVQFELAFSYGEYLSDAQVVNLSNWASVTVALKSLTSASGNAYWSSSIPAASLNNSLTYANWEAGTDQAAVVPVSGSQTNVLITNTSGIQNFLVEITALTVSTNTSVASFTIASGGSGYIVGDIIGVAGGTYGQIAAVQVDTLGASNAVATAHVVQAGSYSAQPSNAVATTGGTGTGCTLNLTWQRLPGRVLPIAQFPIAIYDSGTQTGSPAYVTPPTYYTAAQSDARYLLAADLSAKANLAGANFTGAVVLAADPIVALGASTKQYVDNSVAGAAAGAVPVAGATTVTGAKTFSALLTATNGLTTNALTIGSLSGVLLASAGVVAGSATTANLTESGNLYFTNARAIAAPLTGYAAASGTVTAADSILSAIGKLGYAVANAPGAATVWSVSSQTAMLALSTAKQGDFAYRSDTSTVFVFGGGSPATLADWDLWLYPVSSVNGATGAVSLNSDAVPVGATNLYFTTALANAAIGALTGVAGGIAPLNSTSQVPWANLPPLTGFVSGAGTVTSSDSILQAIQKLNGNIALVSGGPWLPLTAGPTAPLTNPLSYQYGAVASPTIAAGAAAANASFDVVLGGTVVLSCINSGSVVSAPNGFFNAGASFGYNLNGTTFASLSSGAVLLNLGGNFGITTASGTTVMQLQYGSTAALLVDQSAYVRIATQLSMGTNKVIDSSNYYYDQSANRLLAGRQTPSFSGGSGGASGWTDGTAQNDFNQLIAALKNHGLITY